MIGARAGISAGRSAASMVPSRSPSFPRSSSFQDFSQCRTVSAQMPSCLSSSAVLPWPHYRTSLQRHCPQISLSRSSFVDSQNGAIAGLSMVGLKGRLVWGLRRAAKGKKSRTNGTNVRGMAGQSEGEIEEMIKRKNAENAVIVYAKSWCPYCGMVKGLFTKLGVPFKVVELDELIDEQDIEDALTRLTGQRTVPNVFVGGEHIGGCDDTMALHESGGLIPALEAAGLKVT